MARRRVDWKSWQNGLKAQGIERRGGSADEAPECCRRLPEVLTHHRHTIRVLHTLRPIGVAMAGPDVIDLYKDWFRVSDRLQIRTSDSSF